MIYNSLGLLLICINVVIFFTFLYLLLSFFHIGNIVEHYRSPQVHADFGDRLITTMYFSAITLFSVGYGDITPVGWSRMIAILEATVGYILPAVITVQYFRMFPDALSKLFKGLF